MNDLHETIGRYRIQAGHRQSHPACQPPGI